MSAPPIHFGVGVEGLRQLNRDLKKAGDDLPKKLRVAMKTGADLVRNRARSNFDWSSRIPGSVRTSATRNGAKVLAGGPKAPHAAAFENHGDQGFFRHPVFGNRQVWVDQRARPGLYPALVSETNRVLDEVVKGIDAAFKEAGAR